MPRMPLMEYEEPAESVLTDDTCVTEPVDTAQRERGGQGPAGELWGRALRAKQRHSPCTGLMRATACLPCGAGSAGHSECVLRTLTLWQPLHLGDANCPQGPFAQVSYCWGW